MLPSPLIFLLLCVAMLLLRLQQQCRSFLLLFVIVCRMAKIVAGSLNLIPAFSFSAFKRDCFFYVPLGSTVSLLRPRFANMLGNCGGCTEPRRSSARHGKGPLVIRIIHTYTRHNIPRTSFPFASGPPVCCLVPVFRAPPSY